MDALLKSKTMNDKLLKEIEDAFPFDEEDWEWYTNFQLVHAQRNAATLYAERCEKGAIEFAEWTVMQPLNRFFVYAGNGTWIVQKPSTSPMPDEYLTTEQLYQLFLQGSK